MGDSKPQNSADIHKNRSICLMPSSSSLNDTAPGVCRSFVDLHMRPFCRRLPIQQATLLGYLQKAKALLGFPPKHNQTGSDSDQNLLFYWLKDTGPFIAFIYHRIYWAGSSVQERFEYRTHLHGPRSIWRCAPCIKFVYSVLASGMGRKGWNTRCIDGWFINGQ